MALRSVASLREGVIRRSTADPRGIDLLVAGLSLWWVAGLYLDGWAHSHLAGLETFFTPWHAVLYSGYMATAAALAYHFWRGWRATGDWREALPAPYRLSAVGALLFAAGGIADGFWHTLLGVEANVEALVSPPHLVLLTGFVLTIAGPMRAMFARGEASAPGILSASLVLAVLGFFTQVLNPIGRPWAADGNTPTGRTFPLVDVRPPAPDVTGGLLAQDMAWMVGLAGFVIQSALIAGIVLLLWRRLPMPFGTATTLLGLYGLGLGLMRDQTWAIPAAIFAGLAIDGMAYAWKPSPQRPATFLAFVAAGPVVLWSVYFAALAVVDTVAWSPHLVGGAIALGGGVAALLVALSAPAPSPR